MKRGVLTCQLLPVQEQQVLVDALATLLQSCGFVQEPASHAVGRKSFDGVKVRHVPMIHPSVRSYLCAGSWRPDLVCVRLPKSKKGRLVSRAHAHLLAGVDGALTSLHESKSLRNFLPRKCKRSGAW